MISLLILLSDGDLGVDLGHDSFDLVLRESQIGIDLLLVNFVGLWKREHRDEAEDEKGESVEPGADVSHHPEEDSEFDGVNHVLTVVSYISLTVLTVTFSYAVYKRTLAAIQKTSDGHPFGQYLEMDLSISPEKAQELAEIISGYMATYVGELRRLVLVEDMIDSIKFGI
jgi:hypothetical protein